MYNCEVRTIYRSLSNGVYHLQNTASLEQYQVYCHMTELSECGQGGWTLAMKVDGNKVRIIVAYASVNSSVAHPPPGQPPGICTFFFFKLTIPGGRAGKAWQCPAPGQKKMTNARPQGTLTHL